MFFSRQMVSDTSARALGLDVGSTPWHEGEIAMQQRAGTRDDMRDHNPYNRFIPPEYAAFMATLPCIVIGTVRPGDNSLPHASILAGEPGFVDCVDATHVLVRASPLVGDPLAGLLVAGARVGILAIEPQARRRIRLSGTVSSTQPGLIRIDVVAAWGNCPQYIHARAAEFAPPAQPRSTAAARAQSTLDASALALLRKADTMFIASNHATHGPDVSHRGGLPGFVVAADASRVTFPDFKGNGYFQTLGNISVSSTAALFVPDFETGDALFLAGRASIVDDAARVQQVPGALRLVDIDVAEARFVPGVVPLRWSPVRLSRQVVKLQSS